MYTTWEIKHVPADSDGNLLNDQSSIIDDARDILVTKRLGDNRDTFEFIISDKNRDLAKDYNLNDRFFIRRAVNTNSTQESDTKIVGTLRKPEFESAYNRKEIQFKGYSYTDSILSSIVFIDANDLRVDEMFKKAFDHVDEYSGGDFPVDWATGNPRADSDNNLLPEVEETIYNQPFRDVLEKYSQPSNTGGDSYYYYVNTDNELVWQRLEGTVDYTFDSTTDSYIKISDNIDKEDVINFVIAKGGTGPAGQSIQARYSDPVSTSKYDQRFKIIPQIAKNANNLNRQDMASLGYDARSFPQSYPFTTTWKSTTEDPPAKVEVNSDGEYASTMRAHVENLCYEAAKDVVEKRKNGKYQVEIMTKPGDRDWQLGNVIECDIPSIFDVTTKLRVQEIQYASDSDKFILEEDEGTI